MSFIEEEESKAAENTDQKKFENPFMIQQKDNNNNLALIHDDTPEKVTLELDSSNEIISSNKEMQKSQPKDHEIETPEFAVKKCLTDKKNKNGYI